MGRELGRISGPLLAENLLRNGSNLAFDSKLLYLDVANGYIGVNTSTPTRTLLINSKADTTNLIVDTLATIANLEISTDRIQNVSGSVTLLPNQTLNPTINVPRLTTASFSIETNSINNATNNGNITLDPNGTGRLVVTTTNVDVRGDLHATGNITWDGSVTIGSDNTDSVTFNADVNSDLIPNVNNQYNLGNTSSKRWNNLYGNNVTGNFIGVNSVNLGGTNPTLRQGKIYYVATNGNDLLTGTHQQDPFASIKKALSVAVSGDEIYIYPGTYTEIFPLTVPVGVSVNGQGLRSVIVQPTSGTNNKDAFLLNGESTVTNLTVVNFFYNSTNNTGYAFRFAPSAKTTTRSPYVQNCSVITRGSVTSTDDPLGFNQGDAGKGALVDGSVCDATTYEAAMLFHSVTFITPGVDALTMTNGVRVEWLNSFTYFANRSLYATQGTLGLASLGIKFGAEIRSIASASVYGNYGAYADGANTLMYLIQYNFGYIGSGKDSSNDRTLVVQDNEVTELNNGNIYYQSVDQQGTYRVGDVFYADYETGTTSLNVDNGNINGLSSLSVISDGQITYIDANKIDIGNFELFGNTIRTRSGDFNIVAATNTINLTQNILVNGSITTTGNFKLEGVLTIGNQIVDTVNFVGEINSDVLPSTTAYYDIGATPNNNWANIYLNRAYIGDEFISSNSIITTGTNENQLLKANGTGRVIVPNNTFEITNDLTVNGATNLRNVGITGNLSLPGNYTYAQTGDVARTGNTGITGAITSLSGTAKFANNIQISSNNVQTTATDSNLQLTPNGTGQVYIPSNNVQIDNNLTVGLVTQTAAVTVTGTATATTFNVADAYFTDNYFNTITTNRNLELRANGTGKVLVPSKNVEITNDLTVNGATNLKNVGITGLLTLTGSYVQTGAVNRTGNTALVGSTNHLTVSGLGEFSSTTQLNSNTIQTIATNANLVFSANGTGRVIVPTNNVLVSNNLKVSGATATQAVSVTNTAQATTLTAADVYFTDNYFNTTTTNRNLELRANGTGIIKVLNNNVELGNGLTVNGTTSLKTTTIVGTETITGNVAQTGQSPINLVVSMLNTQVFQPTLNRLGGSVGPSYPFVNAINSGQVPVGSQIFVKWALHPVTVYLGEVTGYLNFNTAQAEVTVSNPLNFTLPTYDPSANINYAAQTVIINNGLAYRIGNTNITGNLTASSFAQFEKIRIDSNVVSATATNADLSLQANGIGRVIVPNNNVEITNNLRVLGNTYLKGTIVVGTATAGTFTTGDAYYTSNYFNTTGTDHNLELRANGTGKVQVPLKDVEITNNLTVNGATSLKNTVIGGAGNPKTLTLTGNKTQTGTYTQTGNTEISGVLSVTVDGLFPQVNIVDNKILGTAGNTDVQLKAAGSGRVYVPSDNVRINQALQVVGITDTVDINSNGTVTANKFKTSEITVENNSITTVNGNTNLILNASGTGKVGFEKIYIQDTTISTQANNYNITITPSATKNLIVNSNTAIKLPVGTTANRTMTAQGELRFNTTDSVFSGFSSARRTFGGVYSADRLTYARAHPTNNTISFVANSIPTMTVSSDRVILNGLLVDNNFSITGNTLAATPINSDLIVNPSSGITNANDILFENSDITNTTNSVLSLGATGAGYVKFAGQGGIVIPVGVSADRLANPEVGAFRYNPDNAYAEVYDGNPADGQDGWIPLQGVAATLDAAETQDITNLWALIIG